MNRSTPQPTRASLLLRLREQEELAWREFFAIYTPVVFGYLIRRGLQPNDAEDLTQEVLIEVTRSIRNFDYQPERGRFRDWLGTISRRRLARFWQQRKPLPLAVEDLPGEGTSDPEWVDEFHAVVLQRALQNIQPNFAEVTWQAFLAVWKNGQPAPEVARSMQVSIEIVYNAKSRVLKQLEAEVLRICDDDSCLPNA